MQDICLHDGAIPAAASRHRATRNFDAATALGRLTLVIGGIAADCSALYGMISEPASKQTSQ
jgi:hypothetical protein